MVRTVANKLGFLGWLRAVWRVYRSKETPGWSKLLFGVLAVAYVVSPWDLVPDLILGLGWLDDLIVVPFLVWLATRFAPRQVQQRKRKQVVNERAAEVRRQA